MFDAPLIHFNEPTKQSKNLRLSIQKKLGLEEQKVIYEHGNDLHNTSLLSRVVPRKVYQGRKDSIVDENGDIELIGRFTGNVYDCQGNIKVEKVISNNAVSTNLISEEDRIEGSSNFEKLNRRAVNKKVDLIVHSLEPYPRPLYPYRRFRDCRATRQLYDNPKLSSRMQNVLRRGNPDRNGISYSPPITRPSDDRWKARTIRMKAVYNLTSIVHMSLLRRDYKRAARAFAYLIRCRDIVDHRLVWSLGLELLSWRRLKRYEKEASTKRGYDSDLVPTNGDVSTYPYRRGDKTEDDDYVQWLIVNYPYIRDTEGSVVKSKYRYRVRAPDLYPLYILSKLQHQDMRNAMEILEDITLQPPYSEDPVIFAYFGIANIQMMTLETTKKACDKTKLLQFKAKAIKSFEDCSRLGGEYSMELIDECFEYIENLCSKTTETQEESNQMLDIDIDEELEEYMSYSSAELDSPQQNEDSDPDLEWVP